MGLSPLDYFEPGFLCLLRTVRADWVLSLILVSDEQARIRLFAADAALIACGAQLGGFAVGSAEDLESFLCRGVHAPNLIPSRIAVKSQSQTKSRLREELLSV